MPLTVRMVVFSSEKEPLQDDLDHPEGDGPFLWAAALPHELFCLDGIVESIIGLARVEIYRGTKRRVL